MFYVSWKEFFYHFGRLCVIYADDMRLGTFRLRFSLLLRLLYMFETVCVVSTETGEILLEKGDIRLCEF